MEDKDFAECMVRMVKDNGKDILLNGKAKAYISDYRGQFITESKVFIKLLEADCAKYINEADNVLERKLQLVKRMEEEEFITRKFSMPMLDLLGLLLKGDTSECSGQPSLEPAVNASENTVAVTELKPKTETASITQSKPVQSIAERCKGDYMLFVWKQNADSHYLIGLYKDGSYISNIVSFDGSLENIKKNILKWFNKQNKDSLKGTFKFNPNGDIEFYSLENEKYKMSGVTDLNGDLIVTGYDGKKDTFKYIGDVKNKKLVAR